MDGICQVYRGPAGHCQPDRRHSDLCRFNDKPNEKGPHPYEFYCVGICCDLRSRSSASSITTSGASSLFPEGEHGHVEPEPEPTRHPWAWLLKCVFQLEVSLCQLCGGRMRLLEIVTKAEDAARILADLGLGPRPPPLPAAPVSPRQLRFPFAG